MILLRLSSQLSGWWCSIAGWNWGQEVPPSRAAPEAGLCVGCALWAWLWPHSWLGSCCNLFCVLCSLYFNNKWTDHVYKSLLALSQKASAELINMNLYRLIFTILGILGNPSNWLEVVITVSLNVLSLLVVCRIYICWCSYVCHTSISGFLLKIPNCNLLWLCRKQMFCFFSPASRSFFQWPVNIIL